MAKLQEPEASRIQDITFKFGRVIEKRRIKARMTQQALADSAGLAAGAIYNIEVGRNFPRAANILLLAKALGTHGWMLLKEAEEA